MQIGLALSGGGFRATLYHLGVVRFLKDAGLLPSVTHMTSVSGGSVLAAHLVLNWDRYNGTDEDFDNAAQEVVDFVRLDVRNRIIRRYPFTLAGSFLQRVAHQRSSRKLSRTGLLANHDRDYLYGDSCLYELPSRPELHILSTNLSEGALSSFTRTGLLFEQRSKSGDVAMQTHRGGLTTLSMAVAASSAFPGFFPPLELTVEDMGATEGEFQTQFFTDGGVYGNLGVRMFRYLERQQKSALGRADFSNLESAARAWNLAVQSHTTTPLRRVAEIYAAGTSEGDAHDRAPVLQESRELLACLEHMIAETDLSGDAKLRALLGLGEYAVQQNGNGQTHSNGNGHGHSNGDSNEGNRHGNCRLHGAFLPQDRLSSNRQLLGMAFRDALGEECLGSASREFDAIVASDAGKKFQVTRPDRAGSFLRTAMRSSDILMDRVWQLEKEHFTDSADYVFAPITRTVTREEDASAPHPEVQLQVSRIRTDMDRFSDREVSGLVRHGYCVARQAIAARPALSANSVDGPPWDIITSHKLDRERQTSRTTWRGSSAASATTEARKLQRAYDEDTSDRSCRRATGSRTSTCHYSWQLKLDFRNVPVGHTSDVIVEALLPADPARLAGRSRAWWEFEVDAGPEVATSWVLLPDRWRDSQARLVRYENGNPNSPEMIEPTHRVAIKNNSILNWVVVHPKAGHTYTYRFDDEL